jgi:hypothetical protein
MFWAGILRDAAIVTNTDSSTSRSKGRITAIDLKERMGSFDRMFAIFNLFFSLYLNTASLKNSTIYSIKLK